MDHDSWLHFGVKACRYNSRKSLTAQSSGSARSTGELSGDVASPAYVASAATARTQQLHPLPTGLVRQQRALGRSTSARGTARRAAYWDSVGQ